MCPLDATEDDRVSRGYESPPLWAACQVVSEPVTGTILVVEDDVRSSRLLSANLKGVGHRIVVAPEER
jgi:hypothetical protein